MLQIFIAEDDQIQRENLELLVKNHILIEGIHAKIALSTADPLEIVNHLKGHPNTAGLYLFDIDLGQSEYNGIELAAKVREIDIFGHVVFITVHSELSYLTFVHKVAALDYIIKDAPEGIGLRVKECLQLAYSQYLLGRSQEEDILKIKIGGDIRPIPYKDLMYIETTSQSNKLILHHSSGSMAFRGSMKELENGHDDLYRCDQSYLVNVKNVKAICKQTRQVTMVNGQVVTASVRKVRRLVELAGVMAL